MLLGRDLALRLGVGVGDVVTVTLAQGRLTPFGVLPRAVQVPGGGHGEAAGSTSSTRPGPGCPSPSAQRLFGLDEAVEPGGGAARRHVRGARGGGRRSSERLGDDYVTNDWVQMNQSLFSALWLEKTAIGITIGLIVMVAALNIVATLILMVMEKHQDIADPRLDGRVARGASCASSCCRARSSALVGTLVGGALGWAACQVLDRYKLIRIPEDVYQVSYVPVPARARATPRS